MLAPYPPQSALMPANLITLPHLSVSSAISRPKSAGLIGIGVPPKSSSRAFIFGSTRAALVSLFSLLIGSAWYPGGRQPPPPPLPHAAPTVTAVAPSPTAAARSKLVGIEGETNRNDSTLAGCGRTVQASPATALIQASVAERPVALLPARQEGSAVMVHTHQGYEHYGRERVRVSDNALPRCGRWLSVTRQGPLWGHPLILRCPVSRLGSPR